MSLKKALFSSSSLFFFSLIFFSSAAYAHCPLCTAATGAVVVAARWYGIDDLIVGTFIGGLVISTGYWLNNWLNKKSKGKGYIKFQLPILILISYASIILSFYFSGFLGNPTPAFTVFGMDKLLVGSTIGSIVTVAAFTLHDMLRKQNDNRNFIPFQAIALVISLLLLTAGSFYVLGWIF